MAESPMTRLSVVERVFSNWTALRMTIEHGNGTYAHAHEFCQYIAELLSMNDEQLHHSDIAIELEDFMDSAFNTKLEDESETQVAEEICKFHRLFLQNNLEQITAELARLPPTQPWILPNTPKPSIAKKMDSDSDSEGDDDENIGDGDAQSSSSSKMEVDSEGWAVIRRKKK